MQEEFIQKMKESMLESKKEILDKLAANSAEFKNMIETSNAKDEVDAATDAVDTQMLDGLAEKDTHRLRLIDSALMRIEQGKYGLCMKCGKPIPQERLEAMPYALLCINCKSKDERRNR